MTSTGDRAQEETVTQLLVRGEMADLIRANDWACSPLGPVDSWSPALRTMVTVLLANRFPLLLWWGPDHVQIYNDAYRPVLGTKHPRSLGQSASECWPEIWHIIGPLIEAPYSGGPPTWDDDLFLELNRHGFVEETHFTVAYSPVPDESAPSGIGGVLATVHETTQQVVQERRLALLRDLSARSADAKTAEEACEIAAGVLENHARDVPFALLYLAEPQGQNVEIAATAGVSAADRISQPIDGGWPLAEVLQSDTSQVVSHLADRLESIPPGPWSDPPNRALALPIPSSTPHRPAGVIVLGLSPRLALDESYRSFAALVAGHVGTAIVNARAYEEERKRAEALAELDRAKTAFFSNVSHEFRTPLTLLLGPLEEMLALPAGTPAETARPSLESAHRNSLRLLRLVNTLLDFSRIEAGRAQATFEPTDLAALTADLASVFRSAVERAGLRLIVDCPPLSEPVYVDRDMWEKVVLNLLSNALKFTFDGEITVSLRQTGQAATLTVRDTGTGIPPEELPNIFERFHRVRTARARTHEGTGIGLALVQELVNLHGGTIQVESEVGTGTAVSITLHRGVAHLPVDRIGTTRTVTSTATGVGPFLEEALRWLPDETGGATAADAPSADGPVADATPPPMARLVITDDNADMRAYLRRLLAPRYDVEVVATGDDALAAIRSRMPDLVLSDIMMPDTDGIELLAAIRSNPRTATLPVILLSARAGEEATAAGLRAGADDYLVKPFSADELLARVQAHVSLARSRKEVSDVLVRERDQLRTEIAARRQAEEVARQSHNHLRMALASSRTLAWEWDPVADAITVHGNLADIYGVEQLHDSREGFRLVHPDDVGRHQDAVQRAVEMRTGYESTFRITRPDTGEIVWLEERGTPVIDSASNVLKLIGITVDATARARADAELRRQSDLLGLAHDAIFVRDPHGVISFWNTGATDMYGWTATEAVGKVSHELLQTRIVGSSDPADSVDAILASSGVWNGDVEHTRRDGTRVIVESRQSLLRTSDGAPEAILEVNRDASAREHLTQLQQVTAALSAAATVDQVAEVIIDKGIATMGADVGVVALTRDAGKSFANVRVVGYPDDVVASWPGFNADASVPLADAIRARNLIILSSLDERRAKYPHLLDIHRTSGDGAVVAIPLLIGERPVGALGLSFPAKRSFSALEEAAMRTLAELCAQALERATLFESEAAAKQQAEAQRAQLHELFMRAPAAVGVLRGPEHVIELANPGFANVLGQRELIGKTIREAMPEAEEQGFVAVLDTVYSTGEPYVGKEMLASIDRGRVDEDAYFNFVYQPMRNHDGEIDAILVHAVDVTDQVIARRRVEQLASEREGFLSSAAHDLRTPLTSIRGHAQLAQRRLERLPIGEGGEPIGTDLARIISGTDAVLGLIGELVDMTQLEMGSDLDMRREPTDLVALISAAVAAQQSPASIAIDIDAPSELIAEIDADRISRVVGNLLSNAVKFSPDGTEPITVRLAREGAEAVIVVADNGMGIPAADLPHVFNRFVRAGNAAGRIQGTGIGLASARGIVEQHGGTIAVESVEGQGAAFTVRLPLESR